MCPTGNTTLADPVAGGVWSSADPRIATVDPSTGFVTGLSPDTVDIYYTINPGCAVFIPVTIDPLPPPITGPDIMCPNTVDTVKDSVFAGVWSTLTPTIMSVDTDGVVRSHIQGMATIKYTLATGCITTKQISVEPLPVPTIIYNFVTNSLVVWPDVGWVSYQWYDSLMGKIPGATSPSVAAPETQYYQVEVTDSNGCKGKSGQYHFNRNQLAVNDPNKGHVKIYPNPANSTLYVASIAKLRAVITDVEGRSVIEQADAKAIDISKLADGLYLINLYDENGMRVTVQKFTKE